MPNDQVTGGNEPYEMPVNAPVTEIQGDQIHPIPEKKKRNGKWILIFVLIFALLLVLNETVFKVKNIQVMLEFDATQAAGDRQRSAGEVLEAAGITSYPNYFLINKNKIARNINNDRYLKYVSLEKVFPNKIILTVKQRQNRAYLVVMGTTYIMDEEGMLLEKTDGKLPEVDLLTITGIMPKNRIVGKILVPEKQEQLEAYALVTGTMSSLGILNDYAELNLADADDIYLVTKDGYTVHIGSTEEIRPKLKTVMYVLGALRSEGKKGGILEAKKVGEVIYTPDGL